MLTQDEKKLLTAIRSKCMECSGGSRKDADGCSFRSCALWPYRLGNRTERPKAREVCGQVTMFEKAGGL